MRWKADIERYLNICDFFLPICTEGYFASDWCAREWGLFRQRLLSSVPADKPTPNRLIPIWWRPLGYIPPLLAEYHLQIDENPISCTKGLVDFLRRDPNYGVYPTFVADLARRIRSEHQGRRWNGGGRGLKLSRELRAFEAKNFQGTRRCNVVYAWTPSPDDWDTDEYDERERWDPFGARAAAHRRGEPLTHLQVYENFPVVGLGWALQRFNMSREELAAPDGVGGEDARIGAAGVPTIALAPCDNPPETRDWLNKVTEGCPDDMLTVIVPSPDVDCTPERKQVESEPDQTAALSLARVTVPVDSPHGFAAVLGSKLRVFWDRADPGRSAGAPVVSPYARGRM
jgi:hypothetical protein